jgi:hypothetical protein
MFEYLAGEMKKLESDKKYFDDNPKEQDRTIYFKLIAYVLVIGSLLFSPSMNACESTREYVLSWVCSCGYDNYTGIRYCPLCGGEG